MNRSSLFVALTLGVAVAAAAATANRAGEQEPRGTPMNDTAPSSASIYNFNSKWTTQDGASVGLASFAGKPLVATMGYTTCRDICPAVMADMMWIEKRLPLDAANRVRFAFFSFDSEADTPERLRLYAEGHGLDLTHWTLLRADDDATRELAAALGVGYRANGQGGFGHAAVVSLSTKRARSSSSSGGRRRAPMSC
jgi:protein SCO1/2